MNRAAVSLWVQSEPRHESFIAHNAEAVRNARQNIFSFEPIVAFKKIVWRVSECQLHQHMLHGVSVTTDCRLTSQNVGVIGDAF